jgi:hypothetical protein
MEEKLPQISHGKLSREKFCVSFGIKIIFQHHSSLGCFVCVCVFCSPFVDAAGDAEVHAKKMKRMERKKRFWCSDLMVVEMGGGGR